MQFETDYRVNKCIKMWHVPNHLPDSCRNEKQALKMCPMQQQMLLNRCLDPGGLL